jgi:RHS repeat-associated protein
VVTTSQYDALGRPVRRTAVPPASAPAGLAGDTVLDTWSYDPANGIGQPAMQVRLRGANRTSPDTNPEVWRESYTYEANTSRPSTTTTRNAESTLQVFTATAHYDSAGRPDVTTYSSGLAVRRDYTDQGYLKRLGNEATGVEYWSASAANAWGHVTQESWNSVSGSHVDYASTGQTYRKSWIGTGGSDQVTYGYDSFGNLVSQQRSLSSGGAPTESYVYDGLQRLTQASRPAGSIDYGYTKSGNLARKTDYSTSAANAYQYGGNGCGPHAVSQVQRATGAATFQCDASGNLIGGSTIQATYDAWNLPRTLMRTQIVPGTPPCRRSDTIFCSGFEVVPSTTTNGSMSWTYASDGSRSSEQSSRGLRLYGRNGYEQIGALKVHELGPVVVTRSGTTDTVTAVLKDRLDSTVATIDTAVNRRSYDPFGAVRNGDYATRPNGTLNLAGTIHGFTGHTHADDVALIHMNGRVYDPNLGRFLSVDPVVQFPASTQSLNPYSYLMNNPFSGTDPSGFVCVEKMTGSNICGVDTGAQNGRSSETKTVTDAQTGQKTTYTRTIAANGTQVFVQVGSSGNGARAGFGTKPTGQSDGSKSGTSGVDEVERDPGQQGLQRAAEFGKEFGKVGEEVLNAVNPGDPTNIAIGAGAKAGLKIVGAASGVSMRALARRLGMTEAEIDAAIAGGNAAKSVQTFRNLAPADEIVPAALFPASQIKKVAYSGRLTYVVKESGELVTGRSPHTSLSRGADVIAAGEAQFVNGSLRFIDNFSGHYRPNGISAQRAAEAAFGRAGFDVIGKYIERNF